MKRTILSLALGLTYSAFAQAEMQFEAQSGSYLLTAQPEIVNSTGLELSPAQDRSDGNYENQYFRVSQCQIDALASSGAHPEEMSFLSESALAALKSAAASLGSAKVYSGSGSQFALRSIECIKNSNKSFVIKLKAPYRFNGGSKIDLESFLESLASGRSIEIETVQLAMLNQKLFALVDVSDSGRARNRNDQSNGRHYHFLEIDFSSNDVKVQDLTLILGRSMQMDGSKTAADWVKSVRSIAGRVLILVQPVRIVQDELTRLPESMISFDPASRSMVRKEVSHSIDDYTLFGNRFLVSSGSAADLGGGERNKAGHRILDLDTLTEVPAPFGPSLDAPDSRDSGCASLAFVKRWPYPGAYDHMASQVIKLEDGLVTFSAYSLVCGKPDRQTVRIKATAKWIAVSRQGQVSVRTLLNETVSEIPVAPEFNETKVFNRLITFPVHGEKVFVAGSRVESWKDVERTPRRLQQVEAMFKFDPVRMTFRRASR